MKKLPYVLIWVPPWIMIKKFNKLFYFLFPLPLKFNWDHPHYQLKDKFNSAKLKKIFTTCQIGINP